MINVGDILDVEVEKLTFKGKGLARVFESNFVIFIDDAIPEDKLKVQITTLNKKFANAKIVEITEPSKYRKKPICPIYNACGSCQIQNCDYDFLLEQKTAILKEIFHGIIPESKIFDVIKSPEILEYRHKVQYPCRQTKNSKRILMGYFKKNSHDLTNIKFCPLEPDIINKISQFIKDEFEHTCYSEKTDKGLLKNVLFRISDIKKEILLTLVLNSNQAEFNKKYRASFELFFKKLMMEFNSVKGTFINFNPEKGNEILGAETIKLIGSDFIIEQLEDKKFKIGAVSFFQVNPKSAINLFNIVKSNVEKNSTILDAYAGVGAIGIWCKEKAAKITLVEENKNATSMAKDNYKLNDIKDFEIFEGDAKSHLIDFKNQKRKFDYVILDPPRSGVEKEGLQIISDISKNIIYVSCNPMTLKRDIEYLKEFGFEPEFIKGVDLFPYTYHIECVSVLKKV